MAEEMTAPESAQHNEESSTEYSYFLNGLSVNAEGVKLALDDIRKSGLSPQILEKAQIRIFNGTPGVLHKRCGYAPLADGQTVLTVCTVVEIPYFDENNDVIFYRFKLVPSLEGKQEKDVKYLHPHGQPAIPYILPHIWQEKDKANKPLWVTEGEKKALKLIQHDQAAIALSGVWNFKASKNAPSDEHKDLWSHLKAFEWKGRTVYLAFDSDLSTNPHVQYAVWELAVRLCGLGAVIKFVTWEPSEGKGIDDYLVYRETKGEDAGQVLNTLTKQAKALEHSLHPDHEEAIVRALSVVPLPPLKWERLLKEAARALKVKPQSLEQEIANRRAVAEQKDSIQEEKQSDKQNQSVSDEDKEAALKLLRDPDLVKKYLDVCHMRYLGRDNELILIKLATITRKRTRGKSMVVTGSSSVGKNELVKAVLETVSPEDVEDFTRITPNYLLYRPGELDHKIVYFYETKGTEDAVYLLRSALTEGRLRIGTVVDDPDLGKTTKEIDKSAEGLIVMSTTTLGQLDYELSTRILQVEITHDQTLAKKVYHFKARKVAHPAHTGSHGSEPGIPQQTQEKSETSSPAHQEEAAFRVFQIADQLIEPVAVVIPYGERLAELFPTYEERFHRDFDMTLALIDASALFHTYQRQRDEEGRVFASREDYELVYSLRALLSESVSPVKAYIVKFLKHANDLVKKAGAFPKRQDVQKSLAVGLSTIKRYVRDALQQHLIMVEGEGEGQIIKVLEIPEVIWPLPDPVKLFQGYDEPVSQISKTIDTQGQEPAQAGMSHDEPVSRDDSLIDLSDVEFEVVS